MLIPRRVITHTNCFVAPPQEVFCHTTSQTEAILQLHTVDLGDTGLSHISWLSACVSFVCVYVSRNSHHCFIVSWTAKKWSRVESRITHKHLRHRFFSNLYIGFFHFFNLACHRIDPWFCLVGGLKQFFQFSPLFGEMIQVDYWAGHEMVEFEIQKMGLDLKSWRTTKNRYSGMQLGMSYMYIHVFCIFVKYILYLCISIYILTFETIKAMRLHDDMHWFIGIDLCLKYCHTLPLSCSVTSTKARLGTSDGFFTREILPMGLKV